jgi:DNA repair exonuclease SbcCD ATPase subunit
LGKQLPKTWASGVAMGEDVDALTAQNEQLRLQNLRFRINAPKLCKAVVRFSSSFQTMRGGVSTHLRQLRSELARDCAALATAVATVDAATRARAGADCSANEAERERLQKWSLQLEAALRESQATVQTQQGRMEAMAAELDRKVGAHKDMKEIFEEERSRAEELERDVAALQRNASVKDDRISCLEETQCTLIVQVRVCFCLLTARVPASAPVHLSRRARLGNRSLARARGAGSG